MANQSSPPETDPPADPEAGRIQSLDDRFAAQDEKIDGLGSKLDTILGKLGGDGPKAGASSPDAPSSSSTGTPPGESITALVEQGVAKIRAQDRQAAEAAEAAQADQDWRKSVDDRLAERKPAEPATGRKAKLQRAMFGKPDER